MSNNKKEKWIIDTDPGCDDMMALLYLLRRTEIEILMISVVDGNVSLDNVTQNSRKILKMAGKSIPLYRGSSVPIIKMFENEESYHYCDGLGDIEEIKKFEADDIAIEKENSIIKMIEYIEMYKDEINILCLGPLTTLAAAYMLNPEIVNHINKIYMMGGSTLSKGNLIPCSEFNFAYDFIAAKIIISNFKNIVITPWEPTVDLVISDQTIKMFSENITIKNKKLNQILFYYVSLILTKFTLDKCGTQMCDLYSVIPNFNPECVKKYSVNKLDIIIDSLNMLGMVLVKSKKNVKRHFSELNSLLRDCDKIGQHIIIDEFDERVIIDEYEDVFVDNIL
jgi:inosine-uridine nucleoside N-ribohydrolase